MIIKPVLSLRDGRLDVLERIRSRRRSWRRVLELTSESLGRRRARHMAILNVSAPQDALRFEQQVRESLPCPEEILVAELTPGLSVHTGAGLVGLVTVADSD
jgi:fatty acid-binding protein DegV